MSRRQKRENRRERRLAEESAPSTIASSASQAADIGATAFEQPDRLRPWLLAGAAALFVARPLVPSDGGPWRGDGEPFAALWLVLVLIWALGALGRPRFTLRFGWIDTIALGYFAWWSLSAWRGTEIAAPRPSFNMLWDGVGTFSAFFLLRQLAPVGREARALVAVMIALGVVMAAIAFHQYFVTLPQDRAALKADLQAALREAQWEQLVPGSGEFKLLKDRAESPEPLGTFSLTNSLAAFLAPWLIVAIGIGAVGNSSGAARRRKWLAVAACALPMAAALALTSSRSAWIAAIVGAALVWFLTARQRPNPRNRTWLFAGVAALVVATAGGLAIVRPSLFEPAIRSFGFRLQYWQSSLAMIRDTPLWGCSPGNFGETYTAYKLPDALEEVKDPHNFALEIAVNAGVPALALLATFLTSLICRGVPLLGGCRVPPGRAATPVRQPTSSVASPGEAALLDERDRSVLTSSSLPAAFVKQWHIFGGALAGLALAMVINRLFDFSPRAWEMLAGAVLVCGAIALLRRWIDAGKLPPALMVVGIAVLLVALLAVGGMTFGGVVGTLWLLAALTLNATDRPQVVRSLPWIASVIFLVLFGAIFIFQHQTGYEPVLACNGAMGAAIHAQHGNKLDEVEKQLKLAAEADPYAFEPWRYLAPLRLEQWKQSGSPGKQNQRLLGEYAAATRDHLLRVNPRSAPAWLSVSLGWLEAYRGSPAQHELARTAAGDCQRAAELYPNSAYVRAKLAAALEAAGDAKGAKAAAQEALRLDGLMPFAEAKLPDDIRKDAQRLAEL
jgi:O-antigen ligase/polysaccharide polymerase Wzy-like membrane protein